MNLNFSGLKINSNVEKGKDYAEKSYALCKKRESNILLDFSTSVSFLDFLKVILQVYLQNTYKILFYFNL